MRDSNTIINDLSHRNWNISEENYDSGEKEKLNQDFEEISDELSTSLDLRLDQI